MTSLNSKNNIIAQEILKVPSAKLFTYPTHLNDVFNPGILEVIFPGYEVIQPQIEFTVVKGKTNSLKYVKNYIRSFQGKLVESTYKKIVPVLKFNDDRVFYDARYVDLGNVAHMLMIVVPLTLYLAKNNYPNLTIILNNKVKTTALKICEAMGLPYITTDKEVEGLLVSISNPESCEFLNKYYKFMLSMYDELDLESEEQETYDRIFIARRNNRGIVNENEIEYILNKYGFKKLYFEDIPMKGQWLISKHVKVAIGVHGAAFGALLFNRNNVKVIELFNPGYVVNSIRNIVAFVEGTWCGVTGKLQGSFNEDEIAQNPRKFATSSLIIDPISLEKALKHLNID